MLSRSILKSCVAFLLAGGLMLTATSGAALAGHHPFIPKSPPLPVGKAVPGGGNPHCHCGPTPPP
jgi:hypothetical protein